MKKLPCLLEASRAKATIAVDMDTSQEIAVIRRTITTTTTRTTRKTKGMETRTMKRSLSRTIAIIARKKDIMAKDCFKKQRNEKQKGESANAAQDKEDEVGFVMLGLDDPVDIDEWYTNHSANMTSNECENESRFTKNEQQERFNNSIGEYLGLCSVVVGAKLNHEDESLDTSDSEDMNNLVIGEDN
jgi:hypothetical protein